MPPRSTQQKPAAKNDPISNWGSLETPYSQEAEEAAIGCGIVQGHQFGQFLEIAAPESFFILRHRHIWTALKELHDKKEPIDYLTICQVLKDKGQLKEIGGPAYITQCINAAPNTAEGLFYIQLVQREAIRRQELAFCDALRAAALDKSLTVEQTLEIAAEGLAAIKPPMNTVKPSSMLEIMSQLWDEFDQRLEKEIPMLGIPTGYHKLDEILGGWMPKTFTIWGGRPGMGKTAIMLETALRAARAGYYVLFVSLEMSKQQLGGRMLANHSFMTTKRILSSKLTDAERSAMNKAYGDLSKLPLYIEEPEDEFTPNDLRKLIREFIADHGHIDLVFVDYLQLMTPVHPNKVREVEVSSISRACKQISRKFNISLHVAAQLNRDVEKRKDKHAKLSDLRESGSLEHDSDVVIFPHFEGYYHKPRQPFGDYDVHIVKNRDGALGKMGMYSDFRYMKFSEDVDKNPNGQESFQQTLDAFTNAVSSRNGLQSADG